MVDVRVMPRVKTYLSYLSFYYYYWHYLYDTIIIIENIFLPYEIACLHKLFHGPFSCFCKVEQKAYKL